MPTAALDSCSKRKSPAVVLIFLALPATSTVWAPRFYTILTGKPPYDGPTKADVIRQAREADLVGAYARLEACGTDAELIALIGTDVG